MENSSRHHTMRLFIFAMVISIILGVFTIKKGDLEYVYYFGFPDTFITLNTQNPKFLFGISINLLQFIGNIIEIWLILFYMPKVIRKLILMLQKMKIYETINKIRDRIQKIH